MQLSYSDILSPDCGLGQPSLLALCSNGENGELAVIVVFFVSHILYEHQIHQCSFHQQYSMFYRMFTGKLVQQDNQQILETTPKFLAADVQTCKVTIALHFRMLTFTHHLYTAFLQASRDVEDF